MMSLNKKTVLVLVAVMCLVFGSLFLVYGNSAMESGVNEDGLSYGPALFSATDEEAPDLIATEATNGKNGYVFKTDLQMAEGDNVDNPKEALDYMNKKDSTSKEAFCSSLEKSTGEKVDISLAKFREVRDAFLNEEISAKSIANELGLKNVSNKSAYYEKKLDDAILAAQDANIKTINVYKKDGKTIIGEFEIH